MRILAARFPDRRRASEVKDLLRHKIDGDPPPEVDIAPLGVLGQESATDTLLAGRFADEQAPKVTELVHEAGGEIVVNIDESWTRPRMPSNHRKWSQPPRLNRDGLRA